MKTAIKASHCEVTDCLNDMTQLLFCCRLCQLITRTMPACTASHNGVCLILSAINKPLEIILEMGRHKHNGELRIEACVGYTVRWRRPHFNKNRRFTSAAAAAQKNLHV